jgi:ATP-dependent DNA ligase
MIAQSVAAFPKTRLSVAVLVAYLAHMLQRTLPAGFIAPCLPTKTDKLPSGDLWLHEIKHDGFRVIARKDGDCVRLCSRPGNDMTRPLPADCRGADAPAFTVVHHRWGSRRVR